MQVMRMLDRVVEELAGVCRRCVREPDEALLDSALTENGELRSSFQRVFPYALNLSELSAFQRQRLLERVRAAYRVGGPSGPVMQA